MSPFTSRRGLRYLVPLGAAAVTAVVVALPGSASGGEQPKLPARTAAQLLAALEQADVPSFTGTTVATSRLGLPSLDGAVAGVSAGGQSQLQQAMALLTGSHTAHLAYAGPDKQRIALFVSDLSEMDVVHDGTDLWTYTSEGNAVTHSTLKKDTGSEATDTSKDPVTSMDPTQAAEKALAQIDPSTAVTVDRTARVAGRAAYQIVLTPKDANTLVGSVRLALDAATSMPLRVQVFARGTTSSPAFEVGFTSLSLKTPSDSTFAFSVPSGAHVSQGLLGSPQKDPKDATKPAGGDTTTTLGKDWTSVLEVKAGTDPATGKADSALGGTVDKLGTKVKGGTVISTALLSVLLTDDGRTLVGAVTPAYLESVAGL